MGEESDGKIVPLPRSNANIPMEISVAEASSMFPGFRFSPTDEELIQYYLKKKLQRSDEDVGIITEVDICKHEPWDLPGNPSGWILSDLFLVQMKLALAVIHSDNEWFFFSPRGRKYPNGSQSKRATQSGYWKATGKERTIKSGLNAIGTKRTLVFHTGRAPKGQRTEWIMHEYCASEKSQDAVVVCRLRKNDEFHLNQSTRRNSLSDQEMANTSTTALSGSEKSEKLVMREAMKLDESFKECSSCYSPRSVEQVGTCSGFNDKRASDSSLNDCSSFKKGCTEGDDFYADIMKDDIIKLDDSSDREPLLDAVVKPYIETNSKQPAQSVQPFQGTANRRLRLRRQRSQIHQRRRQLLVQKFDKENIPIENVLDSQSQQMLDNLPNKLSWKKIKFLRIISYFVILILVILLLLVGVLWLLYKHYASVISATSVGLLIFPPSYCEASKIP